MQTNAVNNSGSWAELLRPPEQGTVLGSQFLGCPVVSAEPDPDVASWAPDGISRSIHTNLSIPCVWFGRQVKCRSFHVYSKVV